MLDQLKELLEMQKALDKAMLKERGIEKYPSDEMRIALFVELGELMNELPSRFKVWKKSPVDNREKALEEYADCLAFKMSIYNHSYTDKWCDNALFKYNECIAETSSLFELIDISFNVSTLSTFFALGNKLGFTWEEVYQAYKKKNQVNYESLTKGY